MASALVDAAPEPEPEAMESVDAIEPAESGLKEERVITGKKHRRRGKRGGRNKQNSESEQTLPTEVTDQPVVDPTPDEQKGDEQKGGEGEEGGPKKQKPKRNRNKRKGSGKLTEESDAKKEGASTGVTQTSERDSTPDRKDGLQGGKKTYSKLKQGKGHHGNRSQSPRCYEDNEMDSATKPCTSGGSHKGGQTPQTSFIPPSKNKAHLQMQGARSKQRGGSSLQRKEQEKLNKDDLKTDRGEYQMTEREHGESTSDTSKHAHKQGQQFRKQHNRSPRRQQHYSPGGAHRQQGQSPGGAQRQGHRSPRGDPRQGSQPQGGTPGSANKNRHQQRGHRHHSGAKKQSFEPYRDVVLVQQGLKRGELIQGAVRINPKNFGDAYVPHPDGVSDIYIAGVHDRNRALNGDVVAVELSSREDWRVLDEDLIDSASAAEVTGAMKDLTLSNPTLNPEGQGQQQGSSKEAGSQKDSDPLTTHRDTQSSTATLSENSQKPSRADDVTEISVNQDTNEADITAASDKTKQESAKPKNSTPKGTPGKKRNSHHLSLGELVDQKDEVTRKLFPDGEKKQGESGAEGRKQRLGAVPDSALLRTGKIVYIIERKHSRAATGHLKLMQDKNPNMALFAPIDHRMPRMMVPMVDCPPGFLQRPEDHSNTLFIARIVDWRENSVFADGKLHKSLGEAGQIEPETAGILMENGVDFAEFSDAALSCLPKNLPWKIPGSELESRRDFRKDCVFTIDPATARDLDDAMSCSDLGDGIYEVGVHIADVSYFLKPGSELDRVASDRATSVYLVQKVIPMLPRLLCEELCSLNPDEDRLTFSVVWKMTETGEILDEWFGRTVIRSCVKLSYEHAQGFIDNPGRTFTQDELPPLSEGFTIPQIRERVLNLNKIAVNLRRNRFTSGALRLDQVKLGFSLDKETGLPSGYYVYHHKDSNRLIEEFMLLANMATAHMIYKTYPELAVLRRHPPPQSRMVDDLVKVCHSLGITIDASSAGALQRSLAAYTGGTTEERARMQILVVLCSKPMQNARYFCTGVIDDEELYRHYALNVPLYTHFTSPIRRYPDVMVHRLLAAALGYSEVSCKDKRAIQMEAEHCNDKKFASKRVQELSSDMFFAVFVKECGPLEEDGMVMAVLDKSFDVLVLKLGVVKRVYCEKLPLASHSYRKNHRSPELTLTWASNQTHRQELKQTITIFSNVRCKLMADEQPLKWTALIKHPGED